MRLAAIDIGSNAARLLINDVLENSKGKPEFIKVALVRVPLRLGFDVFEQGLISPQRAQKIVQTIKAYKLLLDVYEVHHLKACATSAMRDAANTPEILQQVQEETGIDIQVVSGKDEASFIYENHIAENLNDQESYLYIDVGGGSTQLSFFSDGKLVAKDSFNIGTIRVLKDLVTDEHWKDLKEFVRSNSKKLHHITAIGSGGNINKVFSLSKRKEGKPLELELLRDYYKQFSPLTLEQRMTTFKLKEDRADVIVPALLIFINVMRWADAEQIYVPQIGLADGLIHMLYEELLTKGILQ